MFPGVIFAEVNMCETQNRVCVRACVSGENLVRPPGIYTSDLMAS